MPRRRRTVAQHARLRSPHPLGQLATLVAVAAVVAVVSALGVVSYTAYDLTADFVDEAVHFTPVVLGIDGRNKARVHQVTRSRAVVGPPEALRNDASELVPIEENSRKCRTLRDFDVGEIQRGVRHATIIA